MADYLFIRLSAADADVATVVLNGDGRIVEPVRRAELASVAELVDGRRVVVLVPGTEVVNTRATLPKASQARIRQLLPYSLEETFAADIDSLHFAAGARTPAGQIAVSVAARERIEAWLAALDAAGVRPHAMVSEADGVPDTPSTLNLLIEGERIYGRRPGEAPFVLEGLTLAEVLELLAAQGGEGTDLQHLLVYLDAAAQQRRIMELAEIHARVASLDVKELPDGVFPRLAATLVFEPGANMLQGSYAPRSDIAPLLRPWYAVASLLIAWIAVTIGAQAIELVSLRGEDRALTEQVSSICTQSFGSARLSACTAEVQSRLAAAGQATSTGTEGFLSTLAVVAASQVEDSRIEALSYRNRTLDLQVIVPSISLLDTFARAVNETNRFDVRIQSTNPGETGIEGRVQVVGAAP